MSSFRHRHESNIASPNTFHTLKMNEHGLQNSIWAHNGDLDHSKRVGNWICPSCGFSNFVWRKLCFRCSHDPHSHGLSTNEHLPVSADSVIHVTTSSQANHQAQPPNGISFQTNYLTVKQKEPGLATSRWAPRNHHARSRHQIWTRIVSNPARATLSFTPTTLDLGLPYEVQHYILTMMQRIIEEACYDLASRWIPQKLKDNRWDCPEAVELSTWRDFLPTALPPSAITPHPTNSLEKALAGSVQIRNAAVHRHLCDNNEIRRMVVKAQDVMSIFSDITRRQKFHCLWIELNEWDQSKDPEAAKERLLWALQEISERPLDDMDWSPNLVSLQEITDVAGEQNHNDDQYHGEAMDLD